MFDYAKYENASSKELFNALTLVEKRTQKLTLQLKENKEAFKFLKMKLKKSLSNKKLKKVEEPTEDTKLILSKNEPLDYNNFDDLLESVDLELKAENA
ncbi:hypothetical protein [Helicobacter winghamensis]|uniref:Uncharacterized protein n=1 Tax=Helicobacter winghamensis TaxID=157268 RepID=A0A2N3PKB0_9HELI|nr:hypothetical protein [Helicobacter winghamensis]PKT77616.1 hypothetical protein BCM32_05335 [Helicobacter winghamensis]PKT81854.1 hypothetical protein BCM31_01330 [Helicobacter winghamensis]PKT82033.1 hypothetical protein BCM33_00595 [Helicobacter winghamensis]QOQ98571.1 hypothetical protein A0Z60_03085 [Helicobacter winghamensis]